MLPRPDPTIVTSGSSSTSSQTQSFSATSSSTSEPVRHGARKGNLVADFAAKPGPAASKVSIPRFQGERRQCGGDLGAAADRGRVHFNSSSYLYFIFKLEYIFHSCYYSYIFFQVEYMKTWFFLDLLSSLPVDYIFLVLDSGLLDTHLVSRFKLSCPINGDQNSAEQANYATTSAQCSRCQLKVA